MHHEALALATATGAGNATVTATRITSASSSGSPIRDGSTLNVDGHTITFKNAGTPVAANVPTESGVNGNIVTDGNGNSTVYLQMDTIADALNAIDLTTGVQTATNATGAATLSTTAGDNNSSNAGRHQRGSGQQPGAVDLPVDRGVRAVAGQPEPAERAPAPALGPASEATIRTAGDTPPFLSRVTARKHRPLPDRRHNP
jgi:Domain of Unknown Function (DUF1522)